MPKLDVDAMKSVFEPIEVILEGKTYRITKVTREIIDAVGNIGIGKEGKENTAEKQLSLLTGEKVETFKNIDIRKIAKAVSFISDTIVQQIAGKGKNG